ncbi:LysR family transcriptional regulator [Bradyrhizobium sp. Cp5.3]|uniref:LysR family transcriptional regulator n=1 Tax=Bradyrhizobium sp. Cp5.3 TaxID=443598 RepID=UPI00040A975F|nr:LysR family transcriptional regulator [Bradyrhizobium sp. Cp5.3]
MSYRLPPLNSLRAFEASARHLSFKRASDELCVTPGAVSQQVKSLEASLGVQLFRRLPRGLLLTAKGESYLPLISNAFRAISDATEHVAPTLKGRLLRVGISRPLSGRRHPAIERLRRGGEWPRTKLTTTDDLSKLIDGKLDVLLRTSPQSPPGLHADRIALPVPSGAALPATLVTLPGLAGCREIRALLRLLTRA